MRFWLAQNFPAQTVRREHGLKIIAARRVSAQRMFGLIPPAIQPITCETATKRAVTGDVIITLRTNLDFTTL